MAMNSEVNGQRTGQGRRQPRRTIRIVQAQPRHHRLAPQHGHLNLAEEEWAHQPQWDHGGRLGRSEDLEDR